MWASRKRERSFGTVNIYTPLTLPSANMLTPSFDCVPRPEHNFLPEQRDVRQNKWCAGSGVSLYPDFYIFIFNLLLLLVFAAVHFDSTLLFIEFISV